MPKNKKTVKFLLSQARQEDEREADELSNGLPEDIFATVVPVGNGKFLSLVISSAEHEGIVAAENDRLRSG